MDDRSNANLAAKVERVTRVLNGIGEEYRIDLDPEKVEELARWIVHDAEEHPSLDVWEWFNIKKIVNDLESGIDTGQKDRVAAVLLRVAERTETEKRMEELIKEEEGKKLVTLEDFGLKIKKPGERKRRVEK